MSTDPSQELIDLLDDGGAVVGTVTRGEMRRGRLPHRCTYVLVFSPSGELLIHRRTDAKEVFPGRWDVTVGGIVAAGESWVDGARREVREEIGVEVEPEFLFDFRFTGSFGTVFGKVFRAVHPGPFRLQAEEVAEASFVPIERLPVLALELPFCPDGLAVWQDYLKRVGIGR